MSIIGLRRVNSHGIIATKAKPQTAANMTMKLEENQSSSRPRSSTISSAPRNVATSSEADQIEAALSHLLVALRARQTDLDQRHRHEADRAVDEETPVPGPVVGEPAAERRADHGRDHHRDAEQREGLAALFRRKRVGEDRLRDRHHAAAAEALQDAEQQQRIEIAGEAAQNRAHA